MPASASACCWASAPASVTGDMAPASVKGVTITHWPCSAKVISPSAIGMSSCKRRVGVDDAGEDRLVDQSFARRAERDRRHFERIDGAVGAEALRLPVLVEQRDLGIIEIEMARIGGKIERLERPAAFLVQIC